VAEKGAPQADPERIAHFRVLGRLGHGGMGVVYRAEDEKLRRQVALKVLPEAVANDEERRTRFLREARSAAAINHPNIATIYEVDETDGRIFIAMELVEGGTLRARLAKGAVTVSEVVRLARGIARGLARAHARGVVHRDLKPDNVMLTEDGEPKILDFGLAKLREERDAPGPTQLEQAETASQVTHEGRLLGTPGYMSPEQARARPVDARTDVFAMGVVLYEMLSGELPFAGESTMDMLMAIARDPHRPLRDRNADVPEALAAIVDKCLAKAPEDRYPSARELAEALETVAVTDDAHVPPSRRGAAATKSLGAAVVSETDARTPRWALAAAGTLVLAIGAGVVMWLARSPTPQPAAGASSAVAAAPSGSVQPVRMVDLPPPKTSSPEAGHEYALAVQALADLQMQSCRAHLLRAVQLDSSFAAAHLLLGFIGFSSLDDQRKEAAAAAQLRAQLSPRDAAILEVMQPLLVKNEFHSDKAWRAWKDLVARFPGDVMLVQAWAWSGFNGGHDAEAMDLIERSRWMEPKSPLWDWEIGEHLVDTGDLAGAAKAADRCLGPTPAAWLCRQVRGNVEARLGQCKQLEDDARAMIALDPDEPVAYDWLAAALLARGAPVESIADASQRARAHESDPTLKEVHQQHDMVTVAELTGDFTSTLALFPRLDRVAAGSTSSDVVGNAFNDEVFALTQVGDDKRAVALADAYMKRLPALTQDEPVALRNVVLRLRHAAHTISDAEFRATREAWSKEVFEQLPQQFANNVWFQFWAEPAATPQEAKEALDTLPRYSPLPPYEGIIYYERVMGQVLLLAGRVDEAIPHLQRAQHACFTPDYVPSHQLSAELLGEALEANGDKDGACAAYGEVLVRWGNAKPRSVTADKARAHMKTLGCGK